MVIELAAAAVLAAMTLIIWPDRRRLVAFARTVHGFGDGVGGPGRPGGWRASTGSIRRRWQGRDHAVRVRPAAVGVCLTAAVTVTAPRALPWQLVIAALVAGYTASSLVRHARAAARRRRDLAGLTAALRGAVRELRAGALPRAAIEHAASGASPAIRLLLESLAPQAATGRSLPATAPEPPPTAIPADVTGRLRRAWAVSAARGVPLAAVLSACIADLDDRAALQRLRAQQVAGPAVSGYVLAALPVAGIAMGAGMGSHPITVLLGSALGGALLVIGVGLCCAGLLWAGRIVRGGQRD